MHGTPPALRRLISELARLPGIGEKTAGRLALFVLDQPSTFAHGLAAALTRLGDEVRRCSECGGLAEGDRCEICLDDARDPATLCVVQSIADQLAIERTGEYQGRYFVLRGLIRPLDGVGPDDIGLSALVEHVRQHDIQEVIIATSASVEGEATSMYLRRMLDPLPTQVSRIARGLPLGSEVEYADRATLGRALASRERLAT